MRRILVLAVTVFLAAACSEAFEPPPDAGGATSMPTPVTTETPEPTPTPVPPPTVMELGDLPEDGEEALHVRVLGWIEVGGSVLCGSGTCIVKLIDPRDPTHHASLEVATGAEGTPNTMVSLGSGYAEADLVVTADDGTELRSGDHAWVTGWWDPGHNTLTANTIAKGTAPKLTVTGTTIAKLETRKPGTLVRLSGRLDTPFLLSCYGGTCNLYLKDADDLGIRIEVRLGAKGEVRPNTMWPLKDNFRDSDLRVIDAKKQTCRSGDRVVVVGWVRKTDDGTAYLDPVVSINRLGS